MVKCSKCKYIFYYNDLDDGKPMDHCLHPNSLYPQYKNPKKELMWTPGGLKLKRYKTCWLDYNLCRSANKDYDCKLFKAWIPIGFLNKIFSKIRGG